MFTRSEFGWTASGTTEFTTYFYDENDNNTQGISIDSSDLVGNLWTPDNSWSVSGTLASIGLTPGTYAIVDALTNESITIQIVPSAAVPEPTSMAIFGLGALGMAYRARRKSHR
jgi:hypothetical protein